MSENYTREYHPPHINVMQTFKRKTYGNYVKAIDELVDNAIDSILRSFRRDPNKKKYKIIFYKRDNDLIIMDNGCGAVGDDIKHVVVLGSSGTKKSGTVNAHGTYGAGATSAAIYLVASETSCNLTAVSFKGNQTSLAEFDLHALEQDPNPWGYGFSHDPSTCSKFQEKLDVLKSFFPKDNSAMAIFIKDGCSLFPKDNRDTWNRIGNHTCINYSKRFRDLKEQGIDIEFEFWSSKGSRRKSKTNTAGFKSSQNLFDCLDYATKPDEVIWYMGAPNGQYEYYNILGIDVGMRMSHFPTWSSRSKSDNWSSGFNKKLPQGISFIRNGKRIETSTSKGWVHDPSKRAILLEVEYSGDHHPHLKVNQEKTEVLLSEEFDKEIKKIIKQHVTTAAAVNISKNNSETADKSVLEPLAQAAAETFSMPRKSKIDGSSVYSKVEEFEKKKESENEKYVGQSGVVTRSTNGSKTRNLNIPEFKIEDNHASRYTPWTESLDESVSPPRIVIKVNRAHPFVKTMLDLGAVKELFNVALTMLLGPGTEGKSKEEIYDDIENFGETYTAICKKTEEVMKKKLKSVA